jgi:hypothetical protein
LSPSGSPLAHGPLLALCLMLSICLPSAGAVNDAAPEGLYRLEDGVLVIDWSPEVGFTLNSTGWGGDLKAAGEENDSLNASLAAPQTENVSSYLNSASSSLSAAEGGAYSGGAHLGWASWDPQAGGQGRHAEYGRRITDLVGVFFIEMQIKLGSNLSSSPGTTEWIPCA